jgi:hypothetical protein
MAGLNGLVSMFKGSDRCGDELLPCNLKQTINDLKKIRADYKKNFNKPNENEVFETKEFDGTDESSLHPTDSFASLITLRSSNEIMRNSIEMLKNGEKFTKVISDDKISNSPQKITKETAKALCASISSLCDSITISPVSFETRRKPPQIKLAKKLLRPARIRKSDKNISEPSKNHQKPKSPRRPTSPRKTAPKIVSTCYAKCRIHRYEDGSYSFEIIGPNLDPNCFGDNNTSEIVFVVLANGETALFRSSSSKSISKILSFNSSQ